MESQVCHWKKEDIIRSAVTSTKYHLDSAFLEMMTLRLIIISVFFLIITALNVINHVITTYHLIISNL